MKFKAKLENTKPFLAIVQCLDKISSECLVLLTEGSFEFRRIPDGDSDVQLYARLKSDVFTEYVVESKAGNHIMAVIKLRSLLRAFKSAGSADFVVFKLTKRGDVPCFTIVADTPSGLKVTQDAPITKFLTRDGLADYREPKLPAPDLSLECPDPRHVRTVLERFRQLDKFVTIEMRSSGSMAFKVDTEVVSMTTTYEGLEVPALKGGGGEHAKMNVRLNINDFLGVLHFGLAPFERAVVVAIKDTTLVVYVQFEDEVATMTYYCPIVDADE